MALNVRYLQRAGTDGAVATAGVGLNAVAGIIGHIALIVVFIGWAGRDAFENVSLPSPEAFLIGIAVVALITALAMLVPRTRRLVTEQLFPIIAKSTRGLAAVLRSPGKLVLLLGGSTLVTLSYAIGFFLAGKAFELDERFAVVAAVYLVGAAVATAAPTPGGLGAVEAALIAGLVAAGIDKEIAVPTVFLYRLATFWFPILPGWGAFTWLRRTDRL